MVIKTPSGSKCMSDLSSSPHKLNGHSNNITLLQHPVAFIYIFSSEVGIVSILQTRQQRFREIQCLAQGRTAAEAGTHLDGRPTGLAMFLLCTQLTNGVYAFQKNPKTR